VEDVVQLLALRSFGDQLLPVRFQVFHEFFVRLLDRGVDSLKFVGLLGGNGM